MSQILEVSLIIVPADVNTKARWKYLIVTKAETYKDHNLQGFKIGILLSGDGDL